MMSKSAVHVSPLRPNVRPTALNSERRQKNYLKITSNIESHFYVNNPIYKRVNFPLVRMRVDKFASSKPI